MIKVPIKSELDLQTILSGFSKMNINELEGIAKELNSIIVRKKHLSKAYKDKQLLQAIQQTTLSSKKLLLYKELLQKLEKETMTPKENEQFLILVKEEETLRFERMQYMGELAQLRQISLPQLMLDLGLTSPNYDQNINS